MAGYSFLVKIGADISDFSKKMDKIVEKTNSVGSGLMSTGKALTAAITLPVVGIAAASTKMAMDFEQSMADVGAVAGATGDEMKQLQELAMRMGAETKYSATEAAKGMEELIKAGVSTQDILGKGALSGALALAAAGELELADAAEIASTALNAFKADGLSVSKAADILAGAANASATSVQELRYSLAASASVAASVGMSFEDTAAALAVFANNGLKGSDAGTSLKTMLMNLQPQTKAQKALFEELGLVTAEGTSKFYDANGSLRSLSDVAGILQSSMSGLNDAQRLQAMTTMFGSDAIRAANILFKEGSKGVIDMKAAMANVTAEEVAAAKMNTVKGAVEKMRGSMETAGIGIGTLFLPAIQDAANFLENLADQLGKLNPQQQQFILTLAGIAAVIGPILLGLGGMIQLFTFLTSSAVGLEIGLGAFLLLGGEIIVIIMALIAIGWTLVSNWGAVTDFFLWSWNSIKGAWGQATTFFSNLWSSIASTAQAIWGNIISFFTVTVPKAIKEMLDWFGTLPEKIGNFFSKLPEIIGYWLGFTLGMAIRIIINMVYGINWILTELPQKVGQIFANLYRTAVNWFENMKMSVMTSVTTMFWNMLSYLSQIPSRVSSYFSSMYNNTVNWINSLSNRASNGGWSIVQNFVAGFWNLPNTIWDVFNRVSNMISSWRSHLSSKASSVASSIWSGFKAGLGIHSPSYIEQAFMNIATSADEALYSIGATIPKYQAMLNTLKTPALQIAGAATPATDYGFMAPAVSAEQNNFNVDTLVVREDADIYRIAQELYKLQQANLRAKGR